MFDAGIKIIMVETAVAASPFKLAILQVFPELEQNFALSA